MAYSRSELIKSALTADQVVRMYGFEPNRAGFIPCPFHADKTGSLKIYPGARGWHCFGCGEGGDVIDFVRRLLNISFVEAMDRLNTDFRLGFGNERQAPAELARLRRETEDKARRAARYAAEYDHHSAEHRRLLAAKKAGYDHPDYSEALRRLPIIENWFDTHPFPGR